MEDYEILLLVGAIMVIGIGAILIFTASLRQKQRKSIADLLQHSAILNCREYHANGVYQYAFETEHQAFFLKVVRLSSKYELIITNPMQWCINDDPKAWKRSMRPKTIDGVSEFIKLKHPEKPTIRIALIVPGCHNITVYLNESDVALVNHTKPVHGVYFVQMQEFSIFLSKFM